MKKKTIKQVCGKINEFIPMVAFRQFLLQTFKKKQFPAVSFSMFVIMRLDISVNLLEETKSIYKSTKL